MMQTDTIYADDNVFATQIKNGNQLAFAAIYDKYHKQMCSIAFRYLKSREMAEDAVQHVFVKFWLDRHNINDKLNIRSFMFTSLKNHTLNVIRDHKRAIAKNYEILMESNINQWNESNEDELLEMNTLIEKAIESLSPQRKQIFTLKITEGLSNPDIANKLSISINTVKVQYYHILKEIKEFAKSNATSLSLLISYMFN